MAYIVPSDISRLALAGAHSPELETLQALRSGLPNDYTVFHGVHWTRAYEGRTVFGEIDFVVLNRSGDLLCIEQKNGALAEGPDGLVKRYGEGEKDPVRQVHRSLERLREKFQWQHGRARRLGVDYLVYLPDYRVKALNAAGLDASRIVDATAAGALAERIQALLGPGIDAGDGWHDKVHAFLCQSFEVVPDIRAHRDSQQRGFVRQVGAVATVLTGLEMTPFRLRFTGTAGSGKSLIARQFVARAAGQGRRVALTCFNRPLAERLKRRVGGGGYVSTFHGLCVEFLQDLGEVIDFGQSRTDPRFWPGLFERVMGARVPDAWRFDALVVDEGQDFEQEWVEILRLFLRDGADLLWLEDPDQNLYGKPPVALDGVVGYRCAVNYRSPDSIARFIRNSLPFAFEPGNALPGLGVGVHAYGDPEEQPRIVARIVQDRIGQGFSHDDMVIVTCRGSEHSVLSGLDRVGGMRLRRFTGEYDDDGNQVLTPGQLTFESIRRFKGQEAPAVILVDVDPDPDARDEALRRIYCGMTRATVRLDLVLRGDNPENRRFLEQKRGR